MNSSYSRRIISFQNSLIPYRNARNEYIIDGNREKYLEITNQVLTVCKEIWQMLNYKDKEKFHPVIKEMEQVLTVRDKIKDRQDILITGLQMKISISTHMLEKMETLKNQGYMINSSLLKKLQSHINYNTKILAKKTNNSDFEVPLLNDITGFILMTVNEIQAKNMLKTSYSIKNYQERMKEDLKSADFWTLTFTSIKLFNIIDDISELSNSDKTIKLIKIIQSIIKENIRKKSKPYNDETYILFNECIHTMKTAKKFIQPIIPIEEDTAIKKKFKDFFIFANEQNMAKFARNIITKMF